MQDFDTFVRITKTISLLSIVTGILLLLAGLTSWAVPMLFISFVTFMAANMNL